MEKMVLESEEILEALEKEIISYPELSLCPSCRRVIPSKVIIKEGYSYLVKKCPFENMKFESLLEKADQPFEKTIDLKGWPHFSLEIGQREITERDIHNLQDIQNIYLLLTGRCNSDCKACYDKCLRPRKDTDINFIKEKLKMFKKKQVYLTGGEPTMRDDLSLITKLVIESRNTPVLLTNGLRLCDHGYLKRLKMSGLSFVYLSFDGFKEKIYEQMRGGKFECKLKLKTLENLKKEKIRTVITVTLAKGINDDQVEVLFDYAKKNNFISEITFRPLYLGGAGYEGGLDKSNLLSRSEINELVCEALGLSNDYFKLFYDVKLASINFIKKSLPNAKINLPQQNQLYLKRKSGGFQPLLTKEELKEITKYLNENKWSKVVKPKYLKILFCLIKNRLIPSKIEHDMFRMGAFRVSQGYVRSITDTLLTERINEITYGPNGIVSWVPD